MTKCRGIAGNKDQNSCQRGKPLSEDPVDMKMAFPYLKYLKIQKVEGLFALKIIFCDRKHPKK